MFQLVDQLQTSENQDATSGGWYRTHFQGYPSRNDPVACTSGGKLHLICKQCLAHWVAADQNSDTQAGCPVRNQDVLLLSFGCQNLNTEVELAELIDKTGISDDGGLDSVTEAVLNGLLVIKRSVSQSVLLTLDHGQNLLKTPWNNVSGLVGGGVSQLGLAGSNHKAPLASHKAIPSIFRKVGTANSTPSIFRKAGMYNSLQVFSPAQHQVLSAEWGQAGTASGKMAKKY
ncbi:hypothetical protein K438DRAFT_1749041 [Mycena galopus ATCC 62051]|nr:hypothetical protein K438DRAFT_1749041 [Mycena galopus ATCC 62051]